MVMGANIGTSVTSTIVAMGQMGNGDQLERAFAGATVHDMFNFISVAILFPVELITGYLNHLTAALVKHATTRDDEDWEGPVGKIVSPLADRLVISNSDIVKAVAKGTASCSDGDGFYPTFCEGGIVSAKTCTTVGLIKCDKEKNTCRCSVRRNSKSLLSILHHLNGRLCLLFIL